MASITKRPNGHRWVQFVDKNGSRKTVRLGKCPQRTAEQWKAKIESLLSAKIAGTTPPEDVAKWLTTLETDEYAKIEAVGLVGPRAGSGMTVGELTEKYLANRSTSDNRSTVLTWEKAARDLKEFFGTKPITEITVGDAQDFQRWLATKDNRKDGGKYSTATVSKRVQIAKQFFNDAMDREWITRNPFRQNKPGSQANDLRKVYVPAADVEKLIESATGTQWKLLLAMCRYVGIRCPSEVVGLTWEDVLWDSKRLVIRSPKTKHHAGKEQRIVPIFPEIMPHLERRFDEAEEGETMVLPMVANQTKNLRTQLQRIAKRAGVTLWPKAFHNLRASAQTDLAANHPSHVVSQWIGNSQAVALRHYLVVTEADFERATSGSPVSGG